MDLLQIVILSIQMTTILTKRHVSSSDESIENLLYFKDCQKKSKPAPTPSPAMPLRAATEPQRQRSAFECPFPKMCCSMTCNNECGGSPMYGQDGSMNFNQPPPRQPQVPVHPPIVQRQKKKVKPPLPPAGARREFGFTKERIKSLIAKDEDIRKILKDLVRVTMQKVDLVAMINARRSAHVADNKKSEISSSADQELEIQ